jgi:hypothetical protein
MPADPHRSGCWAGAGCDDMFYVLVVCLLTGLLRLRAFT